MTHRERILAAIGGEVPNRLAPRVDSPNMPISVDGNWDFRAEVTCWLFMFSLIGVAFSAG
jgi:hypothetical protein